jgi:hypothetical protein
MADQVGPLTAGIQSLFLRRGTLTAIFRDSVATHLKHTCGTPGEVSRRRQRSAQERSGTVRSGWRAGVRAISPDTAPHEGPAPAVDRNTVSGPGFVAEAARESGPLLGPDRYAFRTGSTTPKQPSMMISTRAASRLRSRPGGWRCRPAPAQPPKEQPSSLRRRSACPGPLQRVDEHPDPGLHGRVRPIAQPRDESVVAKTAGRRSGLPISRMAQLCPDHHSRQGAVIGRSRGLRLGS